MKKAAERGQRDLTFWNDKNDPMFRQKWRYDRRTTGPSRLNWA
jgi:hypothetical protein